MQGCCSVFPGRSSGKAVDKDDFALSECPDLSSAYPDHNDNQVPCVKTSSQFQPDLWFDEDSETIGGSQESNDTFADDDSSLADIDVWISDEAESLVYTPLEDSDDRWDSSQSTTLDVCARCLLPRAMLIHDYR